MDFLLILTDASSESCRVEDKLLGMDLGESGVWSMKLHVCARAPSRHNVMSVTLGHTLDLSRILLSDY